ncbi:MAG: flagellar hook-associated protein FlgK [Pseudomonadota bacterium]
MTAGIINSGLSGLFANQVQLETAGHNLANATVDGYHRQRAVLATQESLLRGGFFVGRGVDVQTVERVVDRFVEKQLQEAKSEEAYLDTLQQQVNQISSLLQDGGETLASASQAFFGGFTQLAGAPTSQPQRQLVLATGAAVAGAFATLQRRLDIIRDSLDNGLSSAITQLDDAATNLARINVLIVEQGQTSTTGPSPDLLDSRDRLVNRIGTLVNSSAFTQPDGTVSVQIADGRTLVESGRAARVSARPSETSPANLTLYIEIGGVTTRINETTVTRGTLGGLFEMRRETLDYTEAQLGRLALSLSAEVNELHKSGFDLSGAAGRDIFLFDENQTNSTAETILDQAHLYDISTDYSETAGRRVQSSTQNDGTAQMRYTIPVDAAASLDTRLNNVRQITGDNYSIVYRDDGDGVVDAADFTVTSLFGGRQVELAASAYTAGTGNSGRLEFEGIRLLIDDVTALRPGDAFEVRPTAGFAGLMKLGLSDPRDIAAAADLDGGVVRPGDGRNAQALADLQRAGRIGSADPGEASTFTEAFSEIAGTVGVQAESAKLRGTAQTALVRQLTDQQQSLSGVNLDEEAASLLRFQQAYQASAKLIALAGTLLQSLLDI